MNDLCKSYYSRIYTGNWFRSVKFIAPKKFRINIPASEVFSQELMKDGIHLRLFFYFSYLFRLTFLYSFFFCVWEKYRMTETALRCSPSSLSEIKLYNE